MPAPKRLRILYAIGERLAAAGHVVRYDRQQPHLAELPLVLVYDFGRESQGRTGRRDNCSMNVAVVGYRELTTDNQTTDNQIVANEILADIAEAVELDDKTLGGLLRDQDGLAMVIESPYMPEAGESIVAAEIVYSCPHTRTDGNPEIE